jgi:hypothetical protein
VSEPNVTINIISNDGERTERILSSEKLRGIVAAAVVASGLGAKVCECATQISLHVHPRTSEHYCDWCGGLAGAAQLKAVHRKGICACPSACPRGSHMSRRCR